MPSINCMHAVESTRHTWTWYCGLSVPIINTSDGNNIMVLSIVILMSFYIAHLRHCPLRSVRVGHMSWAATERERERKMELYTLFGNGSSD